MQVIQDRLAKGLQQRDGQTELPTAGQQVGDGEHHGVVKDVPTDGFAERAALRIHELVACRAGSEADELGQVEALGLAPRIFDELGVANLVEQLVFSRLEQVPGSALEVTQLHVKFD